MSKTDIFCDDWKFKRFRQTCVFLRDVWRARTGYKNRHVNQDWCNIFTSCFRKADTLWCRVNIIIPQKMHEKLNTRWRILHANTLKTSWYMFCFKLTEYLSMSVLIKICKIVPENFRHVNKKHPVFEHTADSLLSKNVLF